jgi:hypothetical protein
MPATMFFLCFPNGDTVPTHYSAYSVCEQAGRANQKEIVHGR